MWPSRLLYDVIRAWYLNQVYPAQYHCRNALQPSSSAFQPLLYDTWFTKVKGNVFYDEAMSNNQPCWCGRNIGAFDCPESLHCTYLPLIFHTWYQNAFQSDRIPYINALHFTTLCVEGRYIFTSLCSVTGRFVQRGWNSET